MDPKTILVDPSLPAASTMESAIISTRTTTTADPVSFENSSAVKDDVEVGDYGTNIDDQEETDTGSTISSVVAADNYKFVQTIAGGGETT